MCPPRDSYYLCGPLSRSGDTPAEEKRKNTEMKRSTKWHNHMDAESDVLLHDLVRSVYAKYPNGQNKLYPISHLLLGPQVHSKEFESVYCRLPNFHPIQEAFDEAFSTGAMGDSFDYEFTLATLEACSAYPNRGVMTEVEEDLFEIEQKGEYICGADGVYGELPAACVTRDDGDSVTSIDWSCLPGWREQMIAAVPAYELHHGIDLPKREGETRPPIDLASLSALTNDRADGADAVMHTGGWFVFAKADRWAYRSNEFSNQPYEECKEQLLKQFAAIRGHFDALLRLLPPGDGGEDEGRRRVHKNSASLEKVHAIWRV